MICVPISPLMATIFQSSRNSQIVQLVGFSTDTGVACDQLSMSKDSLSSDALTGYLIDNGVG